MKKVKKMMFGGISSKVPQSSAQKVSNLLGLPTNTSVRKNASPTAQTAPAASPPPTVLPKGINPDFMSSTAPKYTGPGFGAGFAAPDAQQKINQMKSILGGKPMKKGGKVSSASKRADGIAKKGKTKGRMV